MNPDFLKRLQRFVVNVAVSASSLRNQGAEGVVDAARCFLIDLDLLPLKTIELSDFPKWLDDRTSDLVQHLPEGAQNWGAARKVMNILTTQSFLNGRLANAYCLERLGYVMETPLDNMAAAKLRKWPGGKQRLPKFPGICVLTPALSEIYQRFALEVSHETGIPRACLDVILWRPSND